MGRTIKDGTGSGYEAAVDKTNRLKSRSISEDAWVEAVQNGDHFAVTSGQVTLTTADESAMFYLKNDDSSDIVVDRVILNTQDSTGGTLDKFNLKINFGPSGMTSGSGNDLTQVNTNLGSSKTLTLTSEKGLEGASLDNGSVAGNWEIENPTYFRAISVRWYLPKGSSIGLSIVPPTGNTSMVATVALNVHRVSEI